MKKTLTEELVRMHSMMYGTQISEQEFIDRFLKDIGYRKEDDPTKADLVGDDVDEFYETLESAAQSGGISEQDRGSYEFKKEVESMQIGLVILGYDLPVHGVDGLFGPETARAVTKFTEENLGTDGSMNEAVKLVAQGGDIIGTPGQGTHSASGWYNNNAWDITAPVGAEVYSLTNGVVDTFKGGDSNIVKSGVKKIYGDQVVIKSTDGPDVFYTHIDSPLKVGDTVKQGDVIGKIMQGGGITPHVHVGISSGNLSDLATGLSKDAVGSTSKSLGKATPEMLNKLIDMLKQKGVTSEDLDKLSDPTVGGEKISLTGDWLEMSKQLIRKFETFTSRPSEDEGTWRGGYGTSKKLANGKLEDVTPDTRWTKEEAEETLDYQIKNTFAPLIAKQLGVSNWEGLNDKQKASMISFAYNVGPYFITARDYGQKIKDAIQDGDMEAAAAYISQGPTTGAKTGKSYSGLERRRDYESKVFLS